MRLFITLILMSFLSTIGISQCIEDSLNMELKFRYDDASQPGIYNDVWGYVDQDGREYAIIGASDSILIFDITDVDNVVKVGGLHGDGSCSWRDMKTWRNTLYAGSECGDGLLIFDLSDLPNSFTRVNKITSEFTRSHNIYIDSTNSARLYAVGTNGGTNEGMVIYDLEADETDPPVLKRLRLDTLPGEASGGPSYYIHDIFVKNDTAYCSHGETGYAIWDIADVENINRVSEFLVLPMPDQESYVHSSWNVDDDSYAYVATEIGNRQMYIIEQSDKTSISLDTTWKEPLLEPCEGDDDNVPHNPYVHNGLLYISYYQDGINILDISTRREPFRLAFYDTSPNNTIYSGTTANWGVYPFFPSGTIIGSDTNNGLYVLEYTPPIVPLQLLNFEIKYDLISKQSVIDWEIANALNVKEFIVEKKVGNDFREIAAVDFTDKDLFYQYKDRFVHDGHNIYRLKIVDLDGSFEYSEIKQVFIESTQKLSIYPSLNTGQFTVEVSHKDTSYEIYDMQGRLIQAGRLNAEKQEITLETIPGQYVMKVTSKEGISNARFTIIK